jgi:hypothetical protein
VRFPEAKPRGISPGPEVTAGTLKLNPLSNLMFKLLFLLCFYSGGKSKMLKLLGFTRCRVLALSHAATSAPGVTKPGEYPGKPFRCGINPTLS